MGRKLDMTLAILNGLVGDHLVRTKNGLATELSFVQDDGTVLPMQRKRVAKALSAPSPRVAVFVHGLMCTETVWRFPDGSGDDYGVLLERDHDFTPLHVRYNSGRPIVDNGSALSELLEQLVDAYPVPIEELLLVGFSMGGLVIRSACHAATTTMPPSPRWLSLVRRTIYVGTPHRGAPLERAGRVLVGILRVVPDPYTRLIAEICDLRSDGLKDLGDADIRHEDRERTRTRTAGLSLSSRFSLRDPRHPVPLLPNIRHYLAAGTLAADPRLALYFGDALVPIHSGTSDECFDVATLALPPDHVKIFKGFSHVRLAHDAAVYEQIQKWAAPSP